MSDVTLYDLAGADDDIRFSPHCWKTKMALAHKGLDVQTVPWRFTEKQRIASSGQGAVPVVARGEEMVSDSWAIAEWLEREYPDRPSLFPDGGARELARFINLWADTGVAPFLAKLIVSDIHAMLAAEDQDYFRESREARFGQKLESVCSNRQAGLAELDRALAPARAMLRDRPFFSGDAPGYADYCLFGHVMWGLCSAGLDISQGKAPLADWIEKMLAIHDGLASKAKRAA